MFYRFSQGRHILLIVVRFVKVP